MGLHIQPHPGLANLWELTFSRGASDASPQHQETRSLARSLLLPGLRSGCSSAFLCPQVSSLLVLLAPWASVSAHHDL